MKGVPTSGREQIMINYKNSRVRFRNNKPYLAKKIVLTCVVVGLFLYFILTLPWITSLILFLFSGLPIIFKIRKQPSEGKGFFGKVKNFYKNLYKNYVIDEIPVSVKMDEDKMHIALHKAELIRNIPVTEIFTIKKDKIAGILFDDFDNDLLIMFEEAFVSAVDEKTENEVRSLTQMNATICFNIGEDLSIIDKMKDLGYVVEKLTEIEDAVEETEDPELVAKEETETDSNEVETSETENVVSEVSTENNGKTLKMSDSVANSIAASAKMKM